MAGGPSGSAPDALSLPRLTPVCSGTAEGLPRVCLRFASTFIRSAWCRFADGPMALRAGRSAIAVELMVRSKPVVSRGKLKASAISSSALSALPDRPPSTAHQHGDSWPIGCTERTVSAGCVVLRVILPVGPLYSRYMPGACRPGVMSGARKTRPSYARTSNNLRVMD